MRSIVRCLLCIMYVIKCQGYKSSFFKYMTQPYPWETHRWEDSVLLFKTNEQTNSMVPSVHQVQMQKDCVISLLKCRARFLDGLSLLSPQSRNGKLISYVLNENFMPLAHKLSLQVQLILALNLALWDTNASFLFPELMPWGYPDFTGREYHSPKKQGAVKLPENAWHFGPGPKPQPPQGGWVACFLLLSDGTDFLPFSLLIDPLSLIQGSYFLFRLMAEAGSSLFHYTRS